MIMQISVPVGETDEASKEKIVRITGGGGKY